VRHDHHTTIEKDHGRIEIRHCWTVDDPAFLRALPEKRSEKVKVVPNGAA
jgi:hypothetical protein